MNENDFHVRKFLQEIKDFNNKPVKNSLVIDNLKKGFLGAFTIAGVVLFKGSLVLAVNWFFWILWCIVLPAMWSTGPEGFVKPNYWIFLGACFLTSFVGRLLFSRK